MRGLSMPKSRWSDSFINLSLPTIFSDEMLEATSFNLMCPVTTATFRMLLTMIMATSFTPNSFSRYSVWPV